MMVEVIRKYVRKLEFTCPECGSVSKLDESDIRCHEYPYQQQSSYTFNCPVCLHQVRSTKGRIELINDKCFRRLYEQDNADKYFKTIDASSETNTEKSEKEKLRDAFRTIADYCWEQGERCESCCFITEDEYCRLHINHPYGWESKWISETSEQGFEKKKAEIKEQLKKDKERMI